MKRYIKYFVIVSLVFVCLHIAMYYIALKSEAYSISDSFIRTNSTINNRLGKIIDSDLSPSPFEFSLFFSGTDGYSKLTFYIEGEKGKGKVYFVLTESAGVWTIRESNLLIKGKITRLVYRD